MTALELVSISDAWPDTGTELELRVANPDYERELAAHQAVLARNPFARSQVRETLTPTLRQPPALLVGADELCIERAAVTVVIGYPFEGQFAVTLSATTPAGFTRADLFRQLVSVYAAMYEDATYEQAEPLLNTRVHTRRFGRASHRLEELALEGVLLETRPDGGIYAWISIGS